MVIICRAGWGVWPFLRVYLHDFIGRSVFAGPVVCYSYRRLVKQTSVKNVTILSYSVETKGTFVCLLSAGKNSTKFCQSSLTCVCVCVCVCVCGVCVCVCLSVCLSVCTSGEGVAYCRRNGACHVCVCVCLSVCLCTSGEGVGYCRRNGACHVCVSVCLFV